MVQAGSSHLLPLPLPSPRLHSAGLPGDDGGGCRGAVVMAVPAGAPLEGQVGRAASTNCQRPARAAEEPGRSLFCLTRCINREHTHTHTADVYSITIQHIHSPATHPVTISKSLLATCSLTDSRVTSGFRKIFRPKLKLCSPLISFKVITLENFDL